MKKIVLLLLAWWLAPPVARAQWALQPFTFANSLGTYPPCVSAFSIVDAQNVWAVALHQYLADGQVTLLGDNEVAHTANGGATWTVGAVLGVDFQNEIINNVVGLGPSTALICTAGGNRSHGRILKTVDGGVTWTQQTTAGQFTDPNSYADFFFFFTPTEGICVGDPIASVGNRFELYRTTDAGATWAAAPATMPEALAGEYAYDTYSAQVGANVWFPTTAGRVYRSADRGQTWAVSRSGLPGVGAIGFRDANNGLLTSGGRLVRTTDGGASWQPVAYTGPLHQFLAHVPGTDQYLSAGQGPDAGTSYSRDNGATWTALETTRSHFALAAYSPTVAWSGAVAYTATARAGTGAYRLTSTVLGGRPAAPAPAFSLTLFPNPSPDGRVTAAWAGQPVASPPMGERQLRVLDALGRCVRTYPVPPAPAPTLALDLGRLAPGVYTVELRSREGVAQQKLLVQ